MKITLVTPTLNAERHLDEMLASVGAQDWHELEHIVMDGGSTDRTLGILGAHPAVRVVSDADRGLYDAINRGIALASGEIVGFVNADDLLTPGALAAVERACSRPIPAPRWSPEAAKSFGLPPPARRHSSTSTTRARSRSGSRT